MFHIVMGYWIGTVIGGIAFKIYDRPKDFHPIIYRYDDYGIPTECDEEVL